MVGGQLVQYQFLRLMNGDIGARLGTGVRILLGLSSMSISGVKSVSWIIPLKLAPCRDRAGWTRLNLRLLWLGCPSSQRYCLGLDHYLELLDKAEKRLKGGK